MNYVQTNIDKPQVNKDEDTQTIDVLVYQAKIHDALLINEGVTLEDVDLSLMYFDTFEDADVKKARESYEREIQQIQGESEIFNGGLYSRDYNEEELKEKQAVDEAVQ